MIIILHQKIYIPWQSARIHRHGNFMNLLIIHEKKIEYCQKNTPVILITDQISLGFLYIFFQNWWQSSQLENWKLDQFVDNDAKNVELNFWSISIYY